MIARIAMELILLGLALVGGYSVAGWVGVAVVVGFTVTQMVDLAIRLRSPRARALRALARELRDAEAVTFHVHHIPADLPEDEE